MSTFFSKTHAGWLTAKMKAEKEAKTNYIWLYFVIPLWALHEIDFHCNKQIVLHQYQVLPHHAHLVAAGWDERSASRKVEHLSSGWQWRFDPSTYWLWLMCLSSSLSSRHFHQRETQRRDGRGIHGPWGSQWPQCHRRVQRKWHLSCWRKTNTISKFKLLL